MESSNKNVKNLFMIWVLTDSKYGVLQYADNKKVIQDVADAIIRDMVSPVSVQEWEELRNNADNAVYSVVSGAYIFSWCIAAYSAAANAAYSFAASYSDSYTFTPNGNSVVYITYNFNPANSSAVGASAFAFEAATIKYGYFIAASKKLIELLGEAN